LIRDKVIDVWHKLSINALCGLPILGGVEEDSDGKELLRIGFVVRERKEAGVLRIRLRATAEIDVSPPISRRPRELGLERREYRGDALLSVEHVVDRVVVL
jgi:hypothetical protein